MRVVSLLPSATEIIYEIGAGDLLAGRSHDSPPPPDRDDVPVLTVSTTDSHKTGGEIDRAVRTLLNDGRSLFRLDEGELSRLQPDVILTQNTCRVCSIELNTVQRAVRPLDASPLIISCEPNTLEAVFDEMLTIGQALGRLAPAQRAVTRRREQFFHARDHVNALLPGPKAVVLEWINPLFVAGHWTPDLVNRAGAEHLITQTPEPSRQISSQQLVDSLPEFIFIALCGSDINFAAAEIRSVLSKSWWNSLPAVVNQNVIVLDGHRSFSRPSPTLVDTYCLLVGMLNDIPELIPTTVDWSRLKDILQPCPNGAIDE